MNTWRGTARVHSYECDSARRLNPETLLHWMQDAAEAHASSLGFGYEWGVQHGLAWVETSMDVRIERWPSWKEATIYATWTGPASSLQARRHFELTAADGSLLAHADCLWALIDIETRRPVPLKKLGGLLPDEPCARTVFPATAKTENTACRHRSRDFLVTNRDVDFNCHVNNASYLVWALDDLPDEQTARILRGIHLDFRKETLPGEHIFVSGDIAPSWSRHRIEAEGTLRAEILLNWE